MKPSALLLLLPVVAMLISCGVGPDDRTPGLNFTGTAGGCSTIFVTMSNSGQTETMVVNANREALGLSTTPKTFNLASGGSLPDIHIDLYSRTPTMSPYCTDIADARAEKPVQWKAISGTATIVISTDSAAANEIYTATITLVDVTFQDPSGKRSVTLKTLSMKDVEVGWFPG